ERRLPYKGWNGHGPHSRVHPTVAPRLPDVHRQRRRVARPCRDPPGRRSPGGRGEGGRHESSGAEAAALRAEGEGVHLHLPGGGPEPDRLVRSEAETEGAERPTPAGIVH